MSIELVPGYQHLQRSQPQLLSSFHISISPSIVNLNYGFRSRTIRRSSSSAVTTTTTPTRRFYPISASLQELDLTEDNVKQVLSDARDKFSHIFDTSVGMTGVAELAELDGPFVKISLKGRFWHERSLILARLGNYLKQRIPEILEVDIEDEKQLDDSPENF